MQKKSEKDRDHATSAQREEEIAVSDRTDAASDQKPIRRPAPPPRPNPFFTLLKRIQDLE